MHNCTLQKYISDFILQGIPPKEIFLSFEVCVLNVMIYWKMFESLISPYV